jgi:hypothetical protein
MPSVKVIACAAIIEEMLPRTPPDMAYPIFDFGLHVNPQSLKHTLPDAIDTSAPTADTINLGFGWRSSKAISTQWVATMKPMISMADR